MPDQRMQIESLRASILADAALNPNERQRRAIILNDIEARLLQDGTLIAKPHANRARQFMPFAALKGYHELAHDREHVHNEQYS